MHLKGYKSKIKESDEWLSGSTIMSCLCKKWRGITIETVALQDVPLKDIQKT